MILVDSSVWIDFFNGKSTSHSDTLDRLLQSEPLAIGDLILTEVLRGFRYQRDFNRAKDLLTRLTVVCLGGEEIGIQAARNLRVLRGHGVTVRKTIDCIIATKCIESGYDLLYSDQDFDPFVKYLGLRAWDSTV